MGRRRTFRGVSKEDIKGFCDALCEAIQQLDDDKKTFIHDNRESVIGHIINKIKLLASDTVVSPASNLIRLLEITPNEIDLLTPAQLVEFDNNTAVLKFKNIQDLLEEACKELEILTPEHETDNAYKDYSAFLRSAKERLYEIKEDLDKPDQTKQSLIGKLNQVTNRRTSARLQEKRDRAAAAERAAEAAAAERAAK